MQKPPKLGEYNGNEDSDKHIQLVNDILNYYNANDASNCKLLELTLVGPTRLWFNGLPDECIESLQTSMIASLPTLPPG